MMDKKHAIANMQQLIDAAVQKGVFQNSMSVLEIQESLNYLDYLELPASTTVTETPTVG